jgi:hypothetical protein
MSREKYIIHVPDDTITSIYDVMWKFCEEKDYNYEKRSRIQKIKYIKNNLELIDDINIFDLYKIIVTDTSIDTNTHTHTDTDTDTNTNNKIINDTKIYVLKLECDKYYVGITNRDVNVRFLEHHNNLDAIWTKIYKPIEILKIHESNDVSMG